MGIFRKVQEVTYWERTGTNNEGEPTFANPVALDVGRIEQERKETLDPDRNVIVTEYEMEVNQEIPNLSLIWIGKREDLPSPVPELLQVVEYVSIPDYRGREFDRRVELMRWGDKEPEITP